MEHVVDLAKALQSGIFTIVGILIGAWLTRRSELMRLRVERRTQIFDEACALTARYYVSVFSFDPTPVDDNFMISVMCLNQKVLTHFSNAGYTAWRKVEKMIARMPAAEHTATAFTEVRAVALKSLGKELR